MESTRNEQNVHGRNVDQISHRRFTVETELKQRYTMVNEVVVDLRDSVPIKVNNCAEPCVARNTVGLGN